MLVNISESAHYTSVGDYEKIQNWGIGRSKLDEEYVRKEALAWLRKHYETFRFEIPLMIFHGKGMTLSEYIKRHIPNLSLIPRYESLHIEPDLIGLMVMSDSVLVWIIGECKYGNLTYKDLTQSKNYCDIARPYEGYLFYTGKRSAPVQANIDRGNDMFQGVNRLGKPVKKRLHIYKLIAHA